MHFGLLIYLDKVFCKKILSLRGMRRCFYTCAVVMRVVTGSHAMKKAIKKIGVYVVDDNVDFTTRISQLISTLPDLVLYGIARTRM